MTDIRVGQIYKQKNKPYWRKFEDDVFVITFIGYTIHTIDRCGISYDLNGEDWIKGDCDLIAEYPTWQEAVNSPEFRGENNE